MPKSTGHGKRSYTGEIGILGNFNVKSLRQESLSYHLCCLNSQGRFCGFIYIINLNLCI